MIHPLLRLLATEPHLLGDHVEAYAELVGDELSKVSTGWVTRIGLYVGALFLVVIAIVFAGIALMLWGVSDGTAAQAGWLLVAVPLLPAVLAIGCALFARQKKIENAFDNLKKQLNADMAMLREVGTA